MKEFKYVITDKDGLHARPAGALVKAVSDFVCEIKIGKNGKFMNARAIFGIMSLSIKCGDEVVFSFDGTDEDMACEAVSKFMRENL